MMQDDKLLTQYVRDGSEAAFSQLIARHLTLVYRACLRETGSAAQAEDAAQVVFLLLARKAKTLHSGPSLAGWLYRTAVFVAKDVRKQEARRTRREEAVMQEAAHAQAAPDPEWSTVEPFLNSALSALKPADREAVLLRFLEGHTLAETGALLGVSEDAARMRVTRALEKLRRYLTAHGVAATGVVLAALLTTEAARPVSAQAASAVTQGTLQALANGPAPNVLLLSKGVSHTMKIIKLKYAILAVGLLLALGSVPFVGHAVPIQSFTKLPASKNVNVSAKKNGDGFEVLPSVADFLTQRELRLSHLTFAWQIKEENHFLSKAPGPFPPSISTEVWQIARNGSETLVTGRREQGTYQSDVAQYYSGQNGILVNSNTSFKGVSVSAIPPLVWGNLGESVRYREPFQSGFDLLPEHFSLLAGLNPLGLYNAHWRIKETTPLVWVLEASVPQGQAPEPAMVELTLSRRLRGAPAKIVVTQGTMAWTFQTLNYRRSGQDWIGDSASMDFIYPGIQHKTQMWALQTVKPTPSLRLLPIPQDAKSQISDYRVVGLNLTTAEYLDAAGQHPSKIVYYVWPGHFPTVSELAAMKQP